MCTNQDFILPEKWAVLRTKENYKVINEWGNKQKLPHYINCLNDYGGYITFSDGIVAPVSNPNVYDCTIISYEQFQTYVLKQQPMEKQFKIGGKAKYVGCSTEFFTNGKEYSVKGKAPDMILLVDDMGQENFRFINSFEPVEEKKIVGYKLKNNNYLTASMSLVGTTMYREQFIKYLENQKKENSNGAYIGILREAGVLDLWFDEIYEEEKPQTIEMRIGTNKQPIVISKNRITGPDGDISYVAIRQLVEGLVALPSKVSQYDVSILGQVIKIGCTHVSLEELKTVMANYNLLNVQRTG